MARREIIARFRCGYPECDERGHFRCDTRAEAADLQRRYHPDRWRCVRHTRPAEVLSTANPIRIDEQTVFAAPHGNYWGIDRAVSGFLFGPGFKAYAADFPAGTRIRITAEILPRRAALEQEGGDD